MNLLSKNMHAICLLQEREKAGKQRALEAVYSRSLGDDCGVELLRIADQDNALRMVLHGDQCFRLHALRGFVDDHNMLGFLDMLIQVNA